MIAEARREQIKSLLLETGAVTVGQVQARFGVSSMTARRDLDVLEHRGSARRTHGGAVLPSLAAPEDSFTKRVGVAADAKLRIAEAAFAPVGGPHFVDRAFLSVTGLARHRVLTDADGLEAAVKRAMIEQAREPVPLLDASKLATHGKHTIARLSQISLVLADQLHGDAARRLRVDGVTIRDLSERSA